MLVCTHEFPLEHHFQPICLYLLGIDNPLRVYCDIGMINIVSPEHLKKEITTDGSNFTQMLYFSGVLVRVRVDCGFKDDPYPLREIFVDLWDF